MGLEGADSCLCTHEGMLSVYRTGIHLLFLARNSEYANARIGHSQHLNLIFTGWICYRLFSSVVRLGPAPSFSLLCNEGFPIESEKVYALTYFVLPGSIAATLSRHPANLSCNLPGRLERTQANHSRFCPDLPVFFCISD